MQPCCWAYMTLLQISHCKKVYTLLIATVEIKHTIKCFLLIIKHWLRHVTSCPPTPPRTTLTEPVDGHTTPEHAGTVSSLSLVCLWLSLPSQAKNNIVHLLQQLKWCEWACTNSLSSGVLSKQGKDPPRVRILWEISAFFFTSTRPVFLSFLAFIFPRIISAWSQRTRGQNKICIVVACVKTWSQVYSETVQERVDGQISLDVFVCWTDNINKGPLRWFPQKAALSYRKYPEIWAWSFFFFWARSSDHSFWVISSLSRKDSFFWHS